MWTGKFALTHRCTKCATDKQVLHMGAAGVKHDVVHQTGQDKPQADAKYRVDQQDLHALQKDLGCAGTHVQLTFEGSRMHLLLSASQPH